MGRPVRAASLRRKPGQSTIAALLATDGQVPGADRVLGWVRAASPGHWPKVRKAARSAAERGRDVHVREPATHQVGEDLLLGWGPVETDQRMLRSMDRLTRVLPEGTRDPRVEILRYNPLRRLVLRIGPASGPALLARLNSGDVTASARAARVLASRAVPVLAPCQRDDVPRPLYGSSRITTWPWVAGPGDLSDVSGEQEQRRRRGRDAGAALAVLHDQGADLHQLALPRHGAEEIAARRRTAVRAVSALDPGLGERAARLLASGDPVPGDRPTVLHGDFSADQVILDEQGVVRIVDLDRVGTGDPRQDLGSFVASELLRTGDVGLAPDLLRGYGGRLDLTDVADPALVPWIAQGLATRLVEPFRDGDPAWHARVGARLDLLASVLSA